MKKTKWILQHCIEYNSMSASDCRSCHNKCIWYVCPNCRTTSYEKEDTCPGCGMDMELEENALTGRWIYEYTERSDYGEFFICSRCGGLSRDRTKYCPHCGKEMKDKS